MFERVCDEDVKEWWKKKLHYVETYVFKIAGNSSGIHTLWLIKVIDGKWRVPFQVNWHVKMAIRGFQKGPLVRSQVKGQVQDEECTGPKAMGYFRNSEHQYETINYLQRTWKGQYKPRMQQVSLHQQRQPIVHRGYACESTASVTSPCEIFVLYACSLLHCNSLHWSHVTSMHKVKTNVL